MPPAETPGEIAADQSGEVGADVLDAVLTGSSVLLVVGPGGVGKTTLAAALAARAADLHQRRVLVVTVDPARRLAQALGVEAMPQEPVLVPLGPSAQGRLWALMVDMSRSWDELVRRHGPSEADIEALLANPLYRSLTTEFIQSHDYIALDLMCDLANDERYDLVVIDTPPSTHALDVLDAPGRMIEFFDSRLLRWLIAPYRSRVAQVAARPFLALAERLLGAGFLGRIAEFFALFAQLRPGLVTRAREVERRLADAGTGYVLVTTAEPAALEASAALLDELAVRAHPPDLILHNRALPDLPDPVPADAAPTDVGSMAETDLEDAALARAVAVLLARGGDLSVLTSNRPGVADRICAVPWRTSALTTVAELRSLLGRGVPGHEAERRGGGR